MKAAGGLELDEFTKKLLKQAGIEGNELARLGPVEAYLRVRRLGVEAPMGLYYKLVSRVADIDVSEAERAKPFVSEIKRRLQEEGLE